MHIGATYDISKETNRTIRHLHMYVHKHVRGVQN